MSRACRCARRAWSRSRSWCPSRRSGCCASARPIGSTTCSRGARRGRSTGPRSARGRGSRRCGASTAGGLTGVAQMRFCGGGRRVGDMPVAALVDDCPLYDLAPERPAAPLYAPAPPVLAPEVQPREALLALLRSPNVASRLPLFRQYDWLVQSRTVRRPEEADAAVLVLPDGAALAVAIDCNSPRRARRSDP